MYKRVVVPLDGSELAEGILPIASQIAGPLDLEVVLVRVLQPIAPIVDETARPIVVDDLESRRARAREYLVSMGVELTARGLRVQSQVRVGDPAAEVVAAAHEVDADLIAMTTHGRSGLGRLLFGSVAEAVLRRSEVPVLLIRLTEKQLATGRPKEAPGSVAHTATP